MSDSSGTAPPQAVDAIVHETLAYGARRLETGGFLIAPVGDDQIHGVAFAGDTGIVRRHNLFQISRGALDRLFTYADDAGFWIPIQFHSHRYGSGMSLSDQAHGLRVEGFISTIVPKFAQPPTDVSRWGWWRFQHRSWVPIPPISVGPDAIPILLTFDEDGVRAR